MAFSTRARARKGKPPKPVTHHNAPHNHAGDDFARDTGPAAGRFTSPRLITAAIMFLSTAVASTVGARPFSPMMTIADLRFWCAQLNDQAAPPIHGMI